MYRVIRNDRRGSINFVIHNTPEIAVCVFFFYLTFRNRASYIHDGHTATLQTPFYIFFQQIYVLNILNMLHTLRFFSSKCCLFHNATFSGSCIIHLLHTGCAKI
jgi:hypothetical protein